MVPGVTFVAAFVVSGDAGHELLVVARLDVARLDATRFDFGQEVDRCRTMKHCCVASIMGDDDVAILAAPPLESVWSAHVWFTGSILCCWPSCTTTVADRSGEEVVDIRNRSKVGGIVVDVSSEVSIDEESATSDFSAFYSSHQRQAVQLAWLLTHDAEASEDIAHDAFAALFQRFDSLDQPAAYLRTTIVNRVYERTRRVGRERRRVELVAAAEPMAADGPTGGLADVVAKLALKPRTAIVLRYWAGLTDRELADAMRIRPGTARSMISRALAQLRRDMS